MYRHAAQGMSHLWEQIKSLMVNVCFKSLSVPTPIKGSWSQLLKAGQECSYYYWWCADGNNRHLIIYTILGCVNTKDGQPRSPSLFQLPHHSCRYHSPISDVYHNIIMYSYVPMMVDTETINEKVSSKNWTLAVGHIINPNIMAHKMEFSLP